MPGQYPESPKTEAFRDNHDLFLLNVGAQRVLQLSRQQTNRSVPFRVDGLRPELATQLPGYVSQFVDGEMPVAGLENNGIVVSEFPVSVREHDAQFTHLHTKGTPHDTRYSSYFRWQGGQPDSAVAPVWASAVPQNQPADLPPIPPAPPISVSEMIAFNQAARKKQRREKVAHWAAGLGLVSTLAGIDLIQGGAARQNIQPNNTATIQKSHNAQTDEFKVATGAERIGAGLLVGGISLGSYAGYVLLPMRRKKRTQNTHNKQVSQE